MGKFVAWKAAAIGVLLIIALYLALTLQKPALGAMGSAHEHADFKVYLDGIAYNFSQAKYMSPTDNSSGQENCAVGTVLAHLHDMDGNLVHKHATGVTWGYFFSTLNMSLTNSCFALDNGTSYCNGNGKMLRFFVNGKEFVGLADYEIHNLDKVLVTYGNQSESEIRKQIGTITDEAKNEGTGSFCISNPVNSSVAK